MREDSLLIALPALPTVIGDWREWIAGEDAPSEIKMIRNNTRTGFPCGSRDFVKSLESTLAVRLRQRISTDKDGEDVNPQPPFRRKCK
jgi:hypothetical protein